MRYYIFIEKDEKIHNGYLRELEAEVRDENNYDSFLPSDIGELIKVYARQRKFHPINLWSKKHCFIYFTQ